MGIYDKVKAASTVHISFVELSGLEEDNVAVEALTATLPVKLRLAVSRKKFRRHRIIRAAGWLLLKYQLIKAGYDTGILATLQTTAFGKPFIAAPCSFSISFSGNLAVCAVANIKRLGIDIEIVRDINIFELRDYFNGTEWARIVNSENPQKSFFHLWTRKESVLKADGRGLYVDLRDVSINEHIGCIKDCGIRYPLFCLSREIGDNVAATLCTDNPNIISTIEKINISQLRSSST